MSALHFKSDRPPATTPIWDYLDRRTVGATRALAAVKLGLVNSALTTTLPEPEVRNFITSVLQSPETSMGIWNFEVSPKRKSNHGQPLFKMPESELSYELRMQRRTTGPGSPDAKTMLAATQGLLPRILSSGGKIYPPYCPILTKGQWQAQYGTETWRRFAEAKKALDPNSILTPGAGIF
jgi:hypothetical protein